VSNTEFLSLNDKELADLGLTTVEIADCIEDVLIKNATGEVWAPPKVAIQPGDGRYMMATLSASDNPDFIVTKTVTLNPENYKQGLETINGAIMIFDSATGLLRCVMGANWVTAVRTAGLSAVAARKMANPQSSVMAFVGCGVQAHSHLDAFGDLFPLTGIKIFGRGQANIDKLCKAAAAKGLTAEVCETAQSAVSEADLVVTSITVTFSGAPFLDARWLKPGAFATITDLGKPWMPEGMGAFSSIVIDDHAQESAAPVKMVVPDLVSADLAQLVTGSDTHGFDPDSPSAFIFRGMAAGDFAVAALAYQRASS